MSSMPKCVEEIASFSSRITKMTSRFKILGLKLLSAITSFDYIDDEQLDGLPLAGRPVIQ